MKGNTVQAKELGWSLSLAKNLPWLSITYRVKLRFLRVAAKAFCSLTLTWPSRALNPKDQEAAPSTTDLFCP